VQYGWFYRGGSHIIIRTINFICTSLGVLLKDAVNELSSVKIKWQEIGIQLDIDVSELTSFQMSHNVATPLILLSEVLSYWIDEHTDVPVTWESLVTVLRSPSVNENVLAERIHSKYCQKGVEKIKSKADGKPVHEGEAYK
jgi:hypothetical protein